MSVSLVGSIGVGTPVTTGITVTGTYGQSPTANNLLVAVVEISGQSAATFTVTCSTSGWSRLVADLGDGSAGSGDSWAGISIWVKEAVGADSVPSFGYSTGINWGKVYILEFSGANVTTPLDVYGYYQEGTFTTSNSETCTTTAPVSASGEYAICATFTSYNGGGTHTPISGFTNQYLDSISPQYFALDTKSNPASGSVAGGSESWTNSETWVIMLPVIAASSGSVPGAPTGLTATGTTTTNVALSWTAPSGTVTGYYIYQNGVQIASNASTSYTVGGLSAGTSYTFTVAAYNANGTGSQSSGATGTTLTAGAGGNVTAPSVLPGNLLSIADSDFESGTNTWAAYSGANAPSTTTANAFSGNKSLTWTASAAASGLTVVQTAKGTIDSSGGISVSFTNPIASTSAVIAMIFNGTPADVTNSATFNGIVIPGTGTYTPLVSESTTGNVNVAFWPQGIGISGGQTALINCVGVTIPITVFLYEIGNASGLTNLNLVFNAANFTSTTATVTENSTFGNGAAIWIGCVGNYAHTVSGPGGSWTNLGTELDAVSNYSTSDYLIVNSYVSGTNETYTPTISGYTQSGPIGLVGLIAQNVPDSFVASGYYPCTGNNGYDVSGYVLTPDNPHDTYIGVNFYNSSHTLINTQWGNDNPSVANVWQPLVANVTSPAGAAYMKVVVWCGTLVESGEPFCIDLMYVADTICSVWVDWSNPTFVSSSSAGDDFADLTPWVRLDQNINLSHGRQDAISEIQAGQATFYVQNDTGWFTPQKSGSPYFPNIDLGARCQVNCIDQVNAWHTRFDGAISEIIYDVDATGDTNLSQFSASDVLAYLNRQDPLSCWTKETILADNPWLHWTMNDLGTANLCSETSGNNGPSLRATGYGTGTMIWNSTEAGVETLSNAATANNTSDAAYWNPGTVIPVSPVRGLASGVVGPTTAPIGSVQLTPTLTAQSLQNVFVGTEGWQFNAQLVVGGVPTPMVTSTGSYTVEAYFCLSSAVAGASNKDLGPFTVVSLGSSRQATCLVCGVYLNGTAFELAYGTYNQPPSFAYSAFSEVPIDINFNDIVISDAANVVHHLVLEIVPGSPATLNVWVDNVQATAITLPVGQIYDTICVGGAYGGHGNFSGNISCVSIYQYLLSNTQIATHCMAGQYGWWEQTTDNCINELGIYAGVPTFWNNLNSNNYGLTMTDYYSIVGTTPLASMQIYEQTERGLLYVSMEGQLTFHTRDWRMGYGAADVTVPSSVYNPDLGYELVDTFLLNEAATSTVVFTAGVDWISNSSQESFGAYANGTVSSPIQLPLITWSRSWEELGITANEFWADPNLNDNASWQVNTRSSPRLVPGSFTVDLLTIEPSSYIGGLTIASLYNLDTDNMITVSGLPTSFPDQTFAFDYFIEGVNEVIGLNERSLTFFTSPASIQRAWKPGDATYGQLGITSRLGISEPDTSTPVPLGKSVSHDGGPPYWPPAFQTFPGGVQIGYQNQTTTSPVITPTTPSNQGDCILVQVQAPASTTISVADSVNSGNYTLIGSVSNTGFIQYLFAYFDALPLNPATATITITTTTSQEYTTSAYRIWGVSGIDIAANTATGSSTTPAITGTGPMNYTNDFELVITANENTAAVTTLPSGWTQLGNNFQGAYKNQLFWRQATSATTDAFSCTIGASSAWGCIAVSFVCNIFYMNNPAQNGHTFIGSRDLRGIRDNLAMALNPPMLVVAQQNNAQTISTGVQSAPRVLWDMVYVDTVGGMGAINGWPNWYCVMVPGVYEISGCVGWQSQSSGASGQRTGYIIIARNAAALIATGAGNPQSGDTYVCPIGETVNPNNNSGYGPICNPTTRIYLGIGDMVGLGAEHNQGSSITTGTGLGGSQMSLRWLGYNTFNDQFPTVNSPSNTGVVNSSPPATTSNYTKTYTATGTYSYYGGASTWSQPRNHNGLLYQGFYSGASTTGAGSQTSFILFNHTQIASDLSGATINWIYLKMQNQHFWYDNGGYLMAGWTSNTSWGGAFPSGNTLHPDYSRVWYNYGETANAQLSNSIATAFKSSSATAIMVGNNSTENLDYYGYFTGGTFPILYINYTK
jgi:hypothetical protein